MTIAELLALLGRAWSRLLIYPGGLAALAAAWAILAVGARLAAGGVRQAPSPSPLPPPEALSAVALPWLGLALLPLPLAAEFGRPVDIVVLLALLEWPRLLAIARDAQGGDGRRLAAALNGYPPLILATLALAQAAGTLDAAAIAAAPPEGAPLRVSLLHWAGAAAWVVSLPPLLEIGAFACAGVGGSLRAGLLLRAVGIGALAALPWAGLLGEGQGWLLPLPPLVVAALVLICHRVTRGRAPRRWAQGYLLLSALLLAALLWGSYDALAERLR